MNIEAEAAKAVGWLEHRLSRNHTSTAPAAAAVTISTKEVPEMSSLLDEIEADAKGIVAKFAAVDKTALDKMQQIQANPGAMSLIDTALSYLHLPPAAFGVAITALGEVAKLYVPQPAAQQETEQAAPEAPFTPAGPQVGGQA